MGEMASLKTQAKYLNAGRMELLKHIEALEADNTKLETSIDLATGNEAIIERALEAAAKILNFKDRGQEVDFGLPGIGYTLFKDYRPMPAHFSKRDNGERLYIL